VIKFEEDWEISRAIYEVMSMNTGTRESDEPKRGSCDDDMLGPVGRIVVWHASDATIERFRPFSHFGTRDAAEQRARDQGIRNPYLHKVEIDVRKSVWIADSGTGNHTAAGILEYLESPLNLDFEDVSEACQTPGRAASLLKRYGYDALAYINGHEDKGSVSWVGVNTSRIKILEVEAAQNRRQMRP
jgi:hypothetical protein